MTARVHRILVTLAGVLSGVGGLWAVSPPPGAPMAAGGWLAFAGAAATVAATVWRQNWGAADAPAEPAPPAAPAP